MTPERRKRSEAIRRAQRQSQKDLDVPRLGPEKHARIDLGLALLSVYAVPGVEYTRDEIATWCGCSDSFIYLIEQRALKKIRNFLLFSERGKQLLREFRTEYSERRSPASKRATV